MTAADAGSASLTVSGGGSARVTTTAMTERADQLGLLLGDAAGWAGKVTDARYTAPGPPAPVAAALDRLTDTVVSIENECGTLSSALDAAALAYGEAEERARRWAEAGRVFGGPGGEWLGLIAGGSGFTFASAGGNPSATRLLSNPLTIELLRAVLDGAGPVLGLLGLPWIVASTLGAAGREPGVESTAAALVWLAAVLRLAPPRYPTEVTPLGRIGSPAVAPKGYGDLVRSIPTDDLDEDAQIGVQRIGDEFIVYLAGTSDWVVDPTVPFDFGSDVRLTAGLPSGSLDATLATMAAAGIPEGAAVTFVGHSQGGMVAARIAQSGRYDVHDIVNLGGPVRQMDLPAGVRLLSFEHEQDIVPATGGSARAPADEPDTVLVRRALSAHDLEDPAGGLVPGHSLGNYRVSADLADRSSDDRIRRRSEELFARFDGTPGAVEYFQVRGVPPAELEPVPYRPAAGALSPGRSAGGDGR